jgi:hypothetical protein
LKAIDSNFFRQRYLGLITLAAEGREHSVNGITEYISPRILRHRWLGWLSGLRRR